MCFCQRMRGDLDSTKTEHADKISCSQKQPPERFCKKSVLRNSANFTGKRLCQGLFFNKVASRQRYFLVNFVKFLSAPLLQNIFGPLFQFSLKICLFEWDIWHVLEYNLRRQTQSTLEKWTAKLGVLVKIYIFSWDNMVFLWGICLFPKKMTFFFSILNKQLPIV